MTTDNLVMFNKYRLRLTSCIEANGNSLIKELNKEVILVKETNGEMPATITIDEFNFLVEKLKQSLITEGKLK